MDKGLTSSVNEVKAISIATLMKISKSAGSLLGTLSDCLITLSLSVSLFFRLSLSLSPSLSLSLPLSHSLSLSTLSPPSLSVSVSLPLEMQNKQSFLQIIEI